VGFFKRKKHYFFCPDCGNKIETTGTIQLDYDFVARIFCQNCKTVIKWSKINYKTIFLDKEPKSEITTK